MILEYASEKYERFKTILTKGELRWRAKNRYELFKRILFLLYVLLGLMVVLFAYESDHGR